MFTFFYSYFLYKTFERKEQHLETILLKGYNIDITMYFTSKDFHAYSC